MMDEDLNATLTRRTPERNRSYPRKLIAPEPCMHLEIELQATPHKPPAVNRYTNTSARYLVITPVAQSQRFQPSVGSGKCKRQCHLFETWRSCRMSTQLVHPRTERKRRHHHTRKACQTDLFWAFPNQNDVRMPTPETAGQVSCLNFFFGLFFCEPECVDSTNQWTFLAR